ncbi:glycosyltransferase family 39 protein [Candidatus Woesebacteria bacterium]|nr:MAG: glycosyltransferase family 39 protein [Candidatus Woesebacteria bacterium]
MLKNRIGLIFILVLSLLLRLISINQSLWLDEATSVLTTFYTLPDLFTKFLPSDFHPPFYYLVLHFWVGVFGVSELSLRMISLISSLGIVFVTYLIGEKVANKKVGIIASSFSATSGLLIYYSQEARMYSLATFLISISVYFLITKNWRGFGIAYFFALFTHYLSFLMLPVFVIYVFIKRDRKDIKRFAVTLILIGLASTVFAPLFIKQLLSGLSVRENAPGWWNILGKTSFHEVAIFPAKFIFGRISFENKYLYATLTAFCGIVYSSLVIYALPKIRKIDLMSKTLLFWLLIPILTASIIGLVIPVFSYFRLLFVLPALYLLISLGVSKLEAKLGYAAICLVLFINISSSLIYLTNTRFQRENWRGAVDYISLNSSGKVATVFVKDSQKEAYNFYLSKKTDINKQCNEGFFSLCNYKIVQTVNLENLDASYNTVWLMRYVQDIFDPGDTARIKVEELGYEKKSEHDFNGVIIWKYENSN